MCVRCNAGASLAHTMPNRARPSHMRAWHAYVALLLIHLCITTCLVYIILMLHGHMTYASMHTLVCWGSSKLKKYYFRCLDCFS